MQFWGHRDKEGLFTVIGIGSANTEKEADNYLVLYLDFFLIYCTCVYVVTERSSKKSNMSSVVFCFSGT